jgi:hypothetical protein
MSDSIVDKFTIIKTSEGFMIDYMDEYIYTPNGDNTFDTYTAVQLALSQHLINNAIGG